MLRNLLSVLVLFAAGAAASAQPIVRYTDVAQWKPRLVTGLRPTADGEHYTTLVDSCLREYAYADGRLTRMLYVHRASSARPEERAGGDVMPSDYVFSPDGGQVLLTGPRREIYRRSYTAPYYLSALDGSDRTVEVAPEVEGKRDMSYSPDGSRIVFAAGNDLWWVDTREAAEGRGRAHRITTDGAEGRIINGTTDWVYEEEFGFTRAYACSPDGSQIAFLRFDESAVPEYTFMRFDGELYNRPYTYKYPKAGQPNSTVTLWLHDFATGETRQVDTGEAADRYLPHLAWTPEGDLWFLRLDRRQQHLEAFVCEEGAAPRLFYEERSPAYIDNVGPQTIVFLPGGRFVACNETASGWKHLYLYDLHRGLLNPVTQGEWEVTQVVAVTPERIWYLSTEGSPLRRALYSVRPDGRKKRRLTEGEGTYAIAPSEGCKYYIATFSNTATPGIVTLHRGDGRLIRTLEDNAALQARVRDEKLPVKEFLTIPTPQGYELNAYVVWPYGYDPSRRYPVLMTQYSGPGSQSVSDRWSLDWEDVLSGNGYVVVCVDPRGTGFRGEAFKKLTYGQMGRLEVDDQIAAARWVAAQQWADPERIGIYGWSYGGFVSLGCILRGADVFKAAVSVAPVTSWRYYDSIYTERFNGLPEDHPDGYDDNSPVNFADGLQGRLLLIHGTADDNVHIQHCYEMVRALNAAGKDFDLLVFPDDNHSMLPDGRDRIRQKMADWVMDNL